MPEFPESNFEIASSPVSGKAVVKMDGQLLEQAKEKGRPFFVKKSDGTIVKMYPKPAFPDAIPMLEINGTKHRIV